MLRLAVLAGIPVITCRTTDTINLGSVLNYICDGNLAKWNPKIQTERVYYSLGEPNPPVTAAIFSKLVDESSVLIIVNPPDEILEAFDAGEVPVPKELVEHTLSKVVEQANIPLYHRAIAGLTLKQVGEVIRLTQAEFTVLSPETLMRTRAMLAGKMQGLAQVDTHIDFYDPHQIMEEWCDTNRKFFLTPPDDRLTPRGLLLEGPPGVGKTQGAKYIASRMGVPLYRLDLASSLGRYVGESEGNLSRALATIDQEEPCVLLIDEIEKVFAEKEDSGVTSRLLAQLLWWLQEHKSHVLTVMTTNDREKLPQELYRAGRIDRTITLSLLSTKQVYEFAINFIKSWLEKMPAGSPKLTTPLLIGRVQNRMDQSRMYSHAEIVEIVKDLMKENWNV